MPELPEVEHLRRTLWPHLRHRTVRAVRLTRPDIVRNRRTRRGLPAALLRGRRIIALERHGKQLALIGEDGAAVCVHLGMSGQLRDLAPGEHAPQRDHVHCTWHLDHDGTPSGRLAFRDPRRFGGLWAVASRAELDQRWSCLGPDALQVSTAILRQRLSGSRRSVKAALLDQRVVAGLGNIYVDEALHRAGVDPQAPLDRLPREAWPRLGRAVRAILDRAVQEGGSTLRDYRDGRGRRGRFVREHLVYGRGGEACRRCGQPLDQLLVAGRTTVRCTACQPALGGPR